MDRRQFGVAVAALGMTRSASGASKTEVETMLLTANGWMPNNPHLPVLVYRRAFEPGFEAVSEGAAERMEEVFGANGWPAQWRDGVYPFHHYHSTAHEILGFARGRAKLLLGGEGGREVTVEAGDVLALPAGTGHCRVEADEAFLVIGAYPAGQHWDVCRTAPDAAAVERMRRVGFPESDPVRGASGELVRAWRG